jgi:hypothetical protein
VADGNRCRWLPQVPLADLARAIDGALEGPLCQEQRAHLAQVVIDDRLRTVEPQRLDQLADANAGQLGVFAQEPVDLPLEGIELRRPAPPLIARRRLRAQGAADRVAIDPLATHELLDRYAAHEVLPSQLRPALYVQHAPSPGLGDSDRARLPRSPPPATEGGAFSTGEGG